VEAVIVSLLAPFLPYLAKTGQRLAEDAADALAGQAGRSAKSLWAKLRPQVDARPAAAEAVADVAADPQDELARAALQLQLRKLLEEDSELRRDVEGILAEAKKNGVIAQDGGVVIDGSVSAEGGSIGVIGKVDGDVSLRRGSDD
jgi:hypothetical protein